MVIMGIDPGTAITGYGVIVEEAGGRLTHVAHGCITTDSKAALHERLLKIHTGISSAIDVYKPDIVSVELLFFNRNVTNALSVGHARGVTLLAAALKGLRVTEFTPLQVKQAVAGYGRADKQQVQSMVRALLCLEAIPEPDDAADALALAICCAHHAKMSSVLEQGAMR